MAGQKETAIGIATVLASEHLPNPFPLSFRGQSLQEAADLIQLLVAECGDAGIDLARLELDPELFVVLEQRLTVPMRPEVANGRLRRTVLTAMAHRKSKGICRIGSRSPFIPAPLCRADLNWQVIPREASQ